MGSAQSYVSSELVGTVLTGLVIVGAVGVSFTRLGSSSHDDSTTTPSPAIKKGKKKQNKGPALGATSGATASEPPPPQAVYSSNTIPGQFDSSAAESVIPKVKKPKKKKNQNTEDAAKNSSIPSQHHSESSSVPMAKRSPQPQTPKVTPGPEILSPRALLATISLDTDSSWTQVGSKRNRKLSTLRPSGESQSEATSQKDESSPRNTAEDDNHDSFLLQQSMLPPSSWSLQNQKTLAEKLMPNPRKTDVEDLLETPDSPGLSQVVRVTPLPNEKPVAGFSWADYEDVRVATDGGENDADGEDDGWGVVTSKRPRKLNIASQPLKAPETLTKKQRQNAQKREQQKAAKLEAEAQRLATLAGHKRDLEKVRMDGRASSSSKTGGGMRATVDERGKLIWE